MGVFFLYPCELTKTTLSLFFFVLFGERLLLLSAEHGPQGLDFTSMSSAKQPLLSHQTRTQWLLLQHKQLMIVCFAFTLIDFWPVITQTIALGLHSHSQLLRTRAWRI